MAVDVDVRATGVPLRTNSLARSWGTEFFTGWESRHVHYGVNETGNSGAYVNQLGLQVGDLALSAWNGFGLGNSFLEWDWSAAYRLRLGSVFLMPGYNLRYMPGREEPDSSHESEHGNEGHGGEGGHAHKTFGNEIFVSLGTTAIPYVTPSAVFVWDLNSDPGGFLDLRLDADVPVYKRRVSLQPYALLGLNFGYNAPAVYGLNNAELGVQATCEICSWLSVYAGVNYSVALAALQSVGQGDVAWVNAGVRLAY